METLQVFGCQKGRSGQPWGGPGIFRRFSTRGSSAFQMLRVRYQVWDPVLGPVQGECWGHAGITQGSQEENAWRSGVSFCLPCPFQPFNKAETGMSRDSPTNHSGLYHCRLHTERTRRILGEQELQKGRACISLCRRQAELLSCFPSSHTLLVPCSSCRIHQVPHRL